MLVKTAVRNLIGGVSQQPASVRNPNACSEMVNFWPSPVDGLVKRPPAKFATSIDSGPAPATVAYHDIYRDENEQYVVVFETTGIRVFDVQNDTEVPVVAPLGYSYLSSFTGPEDLAITTAGDTTFVVNRNTTTATTGATTTTQPLGNSDDAFVFIRQSGYSSDYTVKFKVNVTNYSFTCTTWNGNNSIGAMPAAIGTGSIDSIKTEDIAADLVAQINAAGITNLTVAQEGSVIHLYTSGGLFFVDINVADSIGDQHILLAHNEVPRVAGYLPEVCYNGFVIKVVGDAEVDGDDYWVKFVSSSGTLKPFNRGTWEETVAPGVLYDLDRTTMPHELIRTFNGAGGSKQFEWGPAVWDTRVVGDDPVPSFTQQRLTDIFYWKDRVGVVTESGNIVMTEVGAYRNFWRTTHLTLRDTDPIDVEINHTKPAAIQRVSVGEDLIIWTNRTQFILRGGDILSPRTVNVTPIAEFENNCGLAAPFTTARTTYFPFKRGEQSGVREMFKLNDNDIYDATDATAQIPEYIQGEIVQIVGSTLEDTIVVRTDADPKTLWVYKYLWGEQGKLQSSWGKWTFTEANIEYAFFIENTLYIVTDRTAGSVWNVEKVTLTTGETWRDTFDHDLYLERPATYESGYAVGYDGINDETTVPYVAGVPANIRAVDDTGAEITINSYSSTEVVLDGDWSADEFYVGEAYESLYEFTAPLVKVEVNGGFVGEYTPPQKVIRAFLQHQDTRHYQVDVAVKNRPSYSYSFDSSSLDEDEFQVPIRGKAKDVTVQLKNTSPFPANITAAQWEIKYRDRARRLG